MKALSLTVLVVLLSRSAILADIRFDGLHRDVTQLLDVTANGTSSAATRARRQYQELKRLNPTDVRIDYAYALVIAKQGRYSDAVPLVSRYLDARQDDAEARRLKMRLQLEAKEYSKVLEAAVEISQRFPKIAQEPEVSHIAAAEYLGTVLAYLELVRPESINVDHLAAAKNRLLANLGDTYVPALDRGRAVIATRIAELEVARDVKMDKADTATRQRQQEFQAALESSRSRVAVEEEVIASQMREIRNAERRLQAIQQQLNQLTQERTRLSAQILSIQTQMTEVQNRVLDVRTRRDLPGTLRSGVVSSSDPRFAPLNSFAVTLTALNKQAFDLDRRILALQADAAQCSSTTHAAIGTIAESQGDAALSEKRATSLERRLDRERAKAAKAQRASKAPLRTLPFSTFVPFPYKQEKARVLAWFAK